MVARPGRGDTEDAALAERLASEDKEASEVDTMQTALTQAEYSLLLFLLSLRIHFRLRSLGSGRESRFSVVG